MKALNNMIVAVVILAITATGAFAATGAFVRDSDYLFLLNVSGGVIGGDFERPYMSMTAEDVEGTMFSVGFDANVYPRLLQSIHSSLGLRTMLAYTRENTEFEDGRETTSDITDMRLLLTSRFDAGQNVVTLGAGFQGTRDNLEINWPDGGTSSWNRRGQVGLHAEAGLMGHAGFGTWATWIKYTTRESDYGRSPVVLDGRYYFSEVAPRNPAFGVRARVSADRIEGGIVWGTF